MPGLQELLSPARAEDLISQLRHNNFALHSLTAQSVFTATLQVGVAAHKTVYCTEDNIREHDSACPVRLPHAHSNRECLVCVCVWCVYVCVYVLCGG